MCQQCKALLKAIDAYLAKAEDDLKKILESEGYTHAGDTMKYIDEIEEGVAGALTAETRLVQRALNRSKDIEEFERIWGDMKRKDHVDDEIAERVGDSFRRFMPKYTEYYLKMTDRALVFHRLSKRATDWMRSWAADLGDLMKLNSHGEIERIYTQGLKEGIGIEEFSRRILESGIRDERYKARRCAVTEVLTAHRAAQQEAFMQSPSVSKKRWMHTGDYRNQPRLNHVEMDGATVDKDSPFELLGADGEYYYPMYPGDTNLPAGERINCHCICQPIVDEDVLGLPLEERERMQREALDSMDDDWEAELDARNRAKAGIE